MINAKIGNPAEIVNNLLKLAKAEGATTLRIEGTLANPRLMDALERRYGVASQGADDFFERTVDRRKIDSSETARAPDIGQDGILHSD